MATYGGSDKRLAYLFTNGGGGGGGNCLYDAEKINGLVASMAQANANLAEIITILEGGGFKIADFDFKTGLSDSINNFTATLTSATRDNTGVIFTAAGNMINLPPVLFSVLRSYEIKVGAMNARSFNNGALFGYNTYQNGSTHGFAYHTATSKWGVWDPSNGWRDTNISDTNYFANSTLKIEICADRKWKLYKDGTLFFEPTGAFPMDGVISFKIGGPQGNSFYNMTIEGLVISG